MNEEEGKPLFALDDKTKRWVPIRPEDCPDGTRFYRWRGIDFVSSFPSEPYFPPVRIPSPHTSHRMTTLRLHRNPTR